MKFILFSSLLLAPSASSIGALTPDQSSKPINPSDKKFALAEGDIPAQRHGRIMTQEVKKKGR
jgi:hypothetical protein